MSIERAPEIAELELADVPAPRARQTGTLAPLPGPVAEPRWLAALALGLGGALVGAAAWAGIVVALHVEVGYVAVLVGYLAGQGVKLGAGPARGPSLQLLAAVLAIAGLGAAKHLAVAWTLDVSPLDPVAFQVLGQVFGKLISPFDLLWLFLAVGAAYRVPAATRLA